MYNDSDLGLRQQFREFRATNEIYRISVSEDKRILRFHGYIKQENVFVFRISVCESLK
jgi:hypothetical protein